MGGGGIGQILEKLTLTDDQKAQIKTIMDAAADAEKFLSQPMPKFAGGLETFRKLDAQIGDAGFAEVDLGSNPGGAVAELMGSETFAIWTLEHREILHALCRWHRDMLLGRLKYILSLGGGPYFCLGGQEFIVPPLHGPADCRDFNTQYDAPIISLIHESGGAVHVHCHGRIARVIDQLVIVRRAPRTRPGLVHAGEHAPRVLGLHADRRRIVERAALGIEEQVGAVEQEEILAGPALRVVERVGLVMELHGDRTAVLGDDAPRARRDLVPRQRLAA